MSGPPGPGPARAMSVGTNGPPSAGLPQHGGMAPQQNAGPPPPSTTGPQSQQNLNQIVSAWSLSLCCHARVMRCCCARLGFAVS